jgi:TolB-like protein/DNA-binding winged helix-turn-helix (wHTH) protein/Tfp pilus assembly protein PilF
MAPAVSAYRFGPYELRPRARELYKDGSRIKLRPQPFRVLEMLVEQPGDVVTRDMLKQLLWSSETFVDFEQGLNTAVKELRASLNDSAEASRYIETVPKLGYRIIVPVEAVPFSQASDAGLGASAKTADTISAAVKAEPAIRRPLFLLRWPAIAGIVAVVSLAAAVSWWWSHKRVGAQPTRGRAMLAVLPFENLTGDASQEYFSDGLTEEMISQLGRIDPERLGVIARTSVMTYKQNPKLLDQVGRTLGVEYVLEGSVRRDANTVRVSAQLIQVKDQTHLWSRQYDRELSNLLALQGEIAQEIADEIELTLGDKPPTKSGSLHPAVSPISYEVYDLCLKGRYFLNQRTETSMHQAAEYFQQAIDEDPSYAPAYADLADALALLSTWQYVPAQDFVPKTRAAALKALQIDDSLAEAHASLALIAEQYDYDWQTAEKEFRRAIQLDPGYATAHQWYAECLSLEGRFDEAFAESERARQLDPLSLIIATDDGVILYYSRQYDRAIEEFQTVRGMQPNFPRSGVIFDAYIAKGDFGAALSEIDEDMGPTLNRAEVLAGQTYVYGRWNRRAQAERSFANFQEESKLHPEEAEAVSTKLKAYMGVGRKDDAVSVLEKCYEEHPNCLIALKVDPFYDPLRGDRRFQNLLRQANLTQ